MAKLIRNRRVEDDVYTIVTLSEGDAPETVSLPAGPALVPLAIWKSRHDELPEGSGVWLAGDEDPADIADNLTALPVIGVNFPKFADGRGYSIATLLRSRYGYTGELRAIGDVLRDQFNYLSRCGFDALQPAEGRYSEAQLEAAIASFDDFAEPYQASVAVSNPLFRRAQRAA
ncbi:DUF934 domain-containing protein [Pseudazoarcus pumilus]|uniref:Oxidoreductase n=1 Tax=Pseudazoarcus pumilus TaxID=2067960 RepID=A0A2I6S3H2_9RHOO|nr:DUF934 domain-containing protein [Pseudazoarcus pumilus]AUN93811.1 oxidoreductase [Pseudazoarcus pumilus]